VECAYFLRPTPHCTLNFSQLALEKERLRQSKKREPVKVELGGREFLLQPYGSGSGYPFVIENADMTIQFGEFNDPSFYVTFRSIALWHKGASSLHQQFLLWAAGLGLMPYRTESLSRVDFTFDFHLPDIDFDEDNFVSMAVADTQYRKNRQIQTFNRGAGDTVLRVYNKVAEINEQSGKHWFFPLWDGIEENVWRIEWQIRKDKLRQFAIRTFDDLFHRKGDVLRHLAYEHTTLRTKTDDTNRSRWPVHPLWQALQSHIGTLHCEGVVRSLDQQELLKGRLMRMAISIQGYLKAIAAIDCVMHGKAMVSNVEALQHLQGLLFHVHDPLTWKTDVQKRVDALRLGQ
jgi:hypothetical protein